MQTDRIEETNENGDTRRHIWLRGLIMLGFMIAFGLGQAILNLIAVVQFVMLVFSGRPNQALSGFGGSLAQWLRDVSMFLCMASDEKPFPWEPWPQTPDDVA